MKTHAPRHQVPSASMESQQGGPSVIARKKAPLSSNAATVEQVQRQLIQADTQVSRAPARGGLDLAADVDEGGVETMVPTVGGATVLRASAGDDGGDDPVGAAREGLSGGGQPLATGQKTRMESAFGVDFSSVRLHTGQQAAQSSASLGANAYAMGSDIAFKESSPSDALLAHELTHVVQQGGGVATHSEVSQPTDASERQATRVERAISGGASEVGSLLDAPSTTVQRSPVQRSEDETQAEGGGGDEGEAAAGESYTVVSGDTLWGIARSHLGSGRRWREIYALNGDVIGPDPNLILPGQVLHLPVAPVPPDNEVPPVAEEVEADGGGDGGGGEAEAEQPSEGSAIVVGESGATEYGFTNRFTPDLVQLMQNSPNASLDEILETIGDQEYQVNYTSDPTFPQPELHPTLTSYGERTDENSSGDKAAMLVANENYPGAALAGVTAQATSLEGQLTGRGYQSPGVITDQTGAGLATAFSGLVSNAEEGDELLAYFIGHGSPEGLAGLDWQNYTNAQVSGLVNSATSKGAHIRFLIDACHAGSAVQAVRSERVNELDARTDDAGNEFLLDLARVGMNFRQTLIDHVNARHSALRQVQSAIDAHNQNAPAAGSPAGAVAAHNAVASALQAAFTAVESAYDAKIDETWAQARAFFVVSSFALSLFTDSELTVPAVAITDHSRLGDQIDFLDDFANACMAPVDEAVGDEEDL